MAALRLKRFASAQAAEDFMNGVKYGKSFDTRAERIYGLVGTSLVFTTPSATVTFAAVPGQDGYLLPAQVLAQINAAASGALRANFSEGGVLTIHEATHATGLVCTGASTASTLSALGLPKNGFTTVKYAAPGGSAPRVISVVARGSSDSCTLWLEEA